MPFMVLYLQFNMEQYQLFLSSYQEDTRLKGPLQNMVTWYKKHLAG